MAEIQHIVLSRLPNGTHVNLIKKVYERAYADEKMMEKCSRQIKALQRAMTNEEKVYKTSPKSFLTDKIVSSDKERDAIYKSYKRIVRGFVGSPDENMSDAAKHLWQHIKDYNINTRSQLDKETGQVFRFIEDLRTKYSEDVATLNISNFVDALSNANQQVFDLMNARADETREKEVGALKQNRKASDEAYYALIKYVNAVSLVDGEADYLNFIEFMNIEIERLKAV